MEPIVKLEAAPTLSFARPKCGACAVCVVSDSDDYRCLTCGTTWPLDSGEGEPGTLYEDWSGETLDLPVTDRDEVWRVVDPIESIHNWDRFGARLSALTRAEKKEAVE